ncbi:MAG: DUF1015 domain-containing protein [Bacteroidetes bacterium]|nr:DUF1015 domain-containing protein [Bacteroidota bacterium]
MVNIAPFNALRPQAQYARQVAAPPYDVLNSREAKDAAVGNPYSFLHITKSEIDLPEGTDIHSEEVYKRAKDNLDAFIQREILFTESKPCYYIYRLTMNGKAQTGLVCVSSLDDYDEGLIKKHEFTRPEKEQDRIDHITATGAQTGNVFLAYKNVEALDLLIEKWTTEKSPVYDFVAEDNISHTIWVVTDDKTIAAITDIFKEKVGATYIADGHHRAASAAKVRLSAAGNSESAAYFLTTLFPASQLHIMDYNRAVHDLNGLSKSTFLEKVAGSFDIKSNGKKAVAPQQLHEFGMYIDREWYILTAKPGTYTDDPIGVLDVTILQNNLLDNILGIQDPRTDKRIDFIGGIRGLKELEKRVDEGEMKVAFSLYPVSIQQLFDIADSGNVMPPKSTWFEPKLRDGLLTHLI